MRRLILFLVLIFFALSSLGQQQPQPPFCEEILGRSVVINAQLGQQISSLQAEVKRLREVCGKPCEEKKSEEKP